MSYGALKGDGTLIFVNATGAVLQTLYILVYLHYCSRKVEALPCALPCWQSKHCFLEDYDRLALPPFPGRPLRPRSPSSMKPASETHTLSTPPPISGKLVVLPSLMVPCHPTS